MRKLIDHRGSVVFTVLVLVYRVAALFQGILTNKPLLVDTVALTLFAALLIMLARRRRG